jgi:hypothetical protein
MSCEAHGSAHRSSRRTLGRGGRRTLR